MTGARIRLHQGEIKVFQRLLVRRDFKNRNAVLHQAAHDFVGRGLRGEGDHAPVPVFDDQFLPAQQSDGLREIADAEPAPQIPGLVDAGQRPLEHLAALVHHGDAGAKLRSTSLSMWDDSRMVRPMSRCRRRMVCRIS